MRYRIGIILALVTSIIFVFFGAVPVLILSVVGWPFVWVITGKNLIERSISLCSYFIEGIFEFFCE